MYCCTVTLVFVNIDKLVFRFRYACGSVTSENQSVASNPSLRGMRLASMHMTRKQVANRASNVQKMKKECEITGQRG